MRSAMEPVNNFIDFQRSGKHDFHTPQLHFSWGLPHFGEPAMILEVRLLSLRVYHGSTRGENYLEWNPGSLFMWRLLPFP